MTEPTLGFYAALAVAHVIVIIATILAFEVKATLVNIVIMEALAGGLNILIFPYLLAAFGG